MAVVGVGIDAVEIDRVGLALQRTPRLIDRLFTDREQRHCVATVGRRRAARFAVRFAAKEAVAKALGTGIVGFGFRDVEILNGANGEPTVVLDDRARRVASHVGVHTVHVSLSVTRDTAVATAIAET